MCYSATVRIYLIILCTTHFIVTDSSVWTRQSLDKTTRFRRQTSCAEGSRTCLLGGCVNDDAICDGKVDCKDGSDEVGCTIKPIIAIRPKRAAAKPPPSTSCLIPYNPTNGIYKIRGSRYQHYVLDRSYISEFALLDVTCNNGYYPSPPRVVPRCVNGTWESPIPKCARECCSDNENCTDGSVEGDCINISTINPTTRITSALATDVLPPPFSGSCIVPNNPTNGFYKVGERDTYQSGSFVPPFSALILICNNGYYSSPSNTSLPLCLDGSWSSPPPTCAQLPDCGLKRSKGTALITGGKLAEKGDYPWHVGIYRTTDKENLCGGSIIRDNIVISAAHCVSNLNTGKLNAANDYLVAAGKYYRTYDDPRDEEAQFSEINNIYIPNRYKGAISHFAEDIAVLKLKTKFNFSISVQPVCIDWKIKLKDQDIDGAEGVVIGWGQTVEGSKPSEILKELYLPLISFNQCFQEVPKIFRGFVTYDKICAGHLKKGQSICQGDSGGGLVFEDTNSAFYLRGIVSTSSATSDGFCDSNQYATYTSVSKHIDFINDAITKLL